MYRISKIVKEEYVKVLQCEASAVGGHSQFTGDQLTTLQQLTVLATSRGSTNEAYRMRRRAVPMVHQLLSSDPWKRVWTLKPGKSDEATDATCCLPAT